MPTTLSRVALRVGGMAVVVEEAIRTRWTAAEVYGHERGYQRDLHGFLCAVLPSGYLVHRERRQGSSRVDLVVTARGVLGGERRLLIEVKRDLTRKAACDRLLGQVRAMDPWEEDILVVLCGRTRPDLLQRVKRELEDSSAWRLFNWGFGRCIPRTIVIAKRSV